MSLVVGMCIRKCKASHFIAMSKFSSLRVSHQISTMDSGTRLQGDCFFQFFETS